MARLPHPVEGIRQLSPRRSTRFQKDNEVKDVRMAEAPTVDVSFVFYPAADP